MGTLPDPDRRARAASAARCKMPRWAKACWRIPRRRWPTVASTSGGCGHQHRRQVAGPGAGPFTLRGAGECSNAAHTANKTALQDSDARFYLESRGGRGELPASDQHCFHLYHSYPQGSPTGTTTHFLIRTHAGWVYSWRVRAVNSLGIPGKWSSARH